MFLGFAAAAALAQGGQVPPGKIYFTHAGLTWSMNGDGSGKTALPAGVSGEPSRQLHGGQRWFLQFQPVGGTYPDGTVRQELFAFRGDGGYAIQLTSQPDLQPFIDWMRPARWKFDDTKVSWVAARFTPLLKAQAAYRIGTVLKDRVLVEDVVGEAWLVALRRLGDLVQEEGRHTPRLLAFLSTTIVHIVNRRIDEILRRGRLPGAGPGTGGPARDLADDRAAEITGAVTHAVRGEIAAAIEEGLKALPPQDRQVIILRAVEGLSNQEAAKELGEPPNTISHRYQRALKKLRDRLPGSVFAEVADE
jgi:RNA polymerase sigma factor (sigma-70 family)